MGLVLILIEIHKMLKLTSQFGKCEHCLFDGIKEVFFCVYVCVFDENITIFKLPIFI